MSLNEPANIAVGPGFDNYRDVGRISNLGGHDTSRARFFLRRRGHVLNMKRALLCLLKNLGGHVPPVPPGSYVSELVHNLLS